MSSTPTKHSDNNIRQLILPQTFHWLTGVHAPRPSEIFFSSMFAFSFQILSSHFFAGLIFTTDEIMDNLQQLQNHVSAENSSKTIARNELAPHSPWGPMTIIIASFLVMVICLATVGNLVVCRLVWVCRRMQIPSLYFVASMSFSDFLTGLLVLPLSLGYHISYQNTGKYFT